MHIVSLVAELLAYPLGVGLAHALPLHARWNPDRHFNIKEHALVTIMSNVSFGFGSADATNIIQAARFYGFSLAPGFSVLVVLCCQLAGYGVAGLSSRWLVEPASMIWPGVLSNIALLSSLHSRANAVADGWRISRINFFGVVAGVGFVWYWLPGLMFTGLSYFTWICWIAPRNVVVNQVFGMVTGMVRLPHGAQGHSLRNFHLREGADAVAQGCSWQTTLYSQAEETNWTSARWTMLLTSAYRDCSPSRSTGR